MTQCLLGTQHLQLTVHLCQTRIFLPLGLGRCLLSHGVPATPTLFLGHLQAFPWPCSLMAMAPCQGEGEDAARQHWVTSSLTHPTPRWGKPPLSHSAGANVRKPPGKLQVVPYRRSHEDHPVRWMDPELSTWGPSHPSPWVTARWALPPAVPPRSSAGHRSRSVRGRRWSCHPASLSPRWSRERASKDAKHLKSPILTCLVLQATPSPLFRASYQGESTNTANICATWWTD